MQHIVTALAVWTAIHHVLFLLIAVRTVRGVPLLDDVRAPEPPRWPRVSLIVAACNEESSLEAAVQTRLAEGYPELEVVLVDDRSTDRTPAIVDDLARRDARVKVVHITSLPEDWLGKLHAMHRGVEVATGEWLLFTDADIHFAPGTLRRVIAACEAQSYDHASVMPRFLARRSLLLDTAIDAFIALLCAGGRLWAVGDPRSSAAVGGGMFNLVRRSAYDRTEGFAWLKMEVADDVVLGQMLKVSGARPAVFNARNFVTLGFYETPMEMARGLEKTGYAVIGQFNLAVLTLVSVVLLGAAWGPFVALAFGATPWVRAVGAVGVAAFAITSVIYARWCGRRVGPALLSPFGATFLVWCSFRSAWLAIKRRGIMWRGTLYPTEKLKAGRRFTLMPR